MRLWSLGFLLGVCGLTFFRNLPNILWLILALIAVLLLTMLLPNRWRWCGRLWLAAVLGFIWIWLFASWQLQHALPASIENKTIIVQGTVNSIPESIDNGVRFEFTIKKLVGNEHNWASPGRVRLIWQNPSINLHVGDSWQLLVRLKRPHGTLNPGGFDYEAWLFEHGIQATGYVIQNARTQQFITKPSGFSFYQLVRLREFVATQIKQQLNNNSVTGFITALSVGIRDSITQSQWQTLRNTGTNHLMAIAGLHIGLFSMLIWCFVNFSWRRFAVLCLRIPAQQAAACAALLAAIFYSALAGFALPTVRAVIMIAVFLSATLLRRNLLKWQTFFIALWLVLLLNPLAILSASFWLSFAAVALIIYGMSGDNPHSKWQRWIKVQWVIAVGFIPLSLLFFQQVSFIGFVANLIAIPWVGFIVLPLSILGGLLILINQHIGGCILHLAALMMNLFWPVLQTLGEISQLQWHAAIQNIGLLITAVVGVLLLLAPKKNYIRVGGIIFFLPLIFWHAPAPKWGDVDFTLLDVGEGLAAVVRTTNHLLIYDAGAKFNELDMGDSVVIPYLRMLGLHKLDVLMISHGDNDHSGGVAAVLREIKVKQIITSIPNFSWGQARCLTPIQVCGQGQHWQWDGVGFQVLYPPAGQSYLDNDSSCVLKITSGKNSILLTGDIGKKSEAYLVQNQSMLLPTTILVAPHHGSSSSSTINFVNAVHPQYVLFSVGYLNRFHFPNANVVQRYAQIGAKLFNTANDGMLWFQLTNDGIQFDSYRKTHSKFWNA